MTYLTDYEVIVATSGALFIAATNYEALMTKGSGISSQEQIFRKCKYVLT